MPRQRVIGVIGSNSAGPETLAVAEALGAAIVRAGFSLVCGGMGGVMEAASKGAAECPDRGAAVVIGVVPSDRHDQANEFIDVVIPTGMGYARNTLVALAADGLVAVEGGSGTLSEIALAWQHGRPVACLPGTGGWADRLAGEALDHRRPGERVEPFDDPAAAVAWLASRFGEL